MLKYSCVEAILSIHTQSTRFQKTRFYFDYLVDDFGTPSHEYTKKVTTLTSRHSAFGSNVCSVLKFKQIFIHPENCGVAKLWSTAYAWCIQRTYKESFCRLVAIV